MNLDNIKNMTASCGAGQTGSKTWFKILRGGTSKNGNVEVQINLTELNKAVEAGAYTFDSKKTGDKFLPCNVKVWEPRDEGQPVTAQPAKPVSKNNADIDDDLPF